MEDLPRNLIIYARSPPSPPSGRQSIHSAATGPRSGGPGSSLTEFQDLCKYLRMNADKMACGRDPDSEFVELAVEVFSMLADATRVRIILALRESGELSVNRLAELVEKAPAGVSQHLAKLRLARIVSARQEGTRAFYRLANEHASQMVSDAIFQAEHSLGGVPRHHHVNADSVRKASA